MSEQVVQQAPKVPVAYVQDRIKWLKERCEFWSVPERHFMEHLIDQAFADLQQQGKP